jgi:hypothetical protein
VGIEGHHVTGEINHPPSALIGEAASLFYLLGGMAAKHLVIVGGLVPPLLVPEAADAHIGSADIDLCLSLAITGGATREYYRSIQETLEPHFELERASGFRWRKKESAPGLPLVLDFLAPVAEDDTLLADGTRALDEKIAAQNAGPRLRPLPTRSGGLIDEDALSSILEGIQLVYRPGARADVQIRHAGPVGFLAAKADALEGRDDSKDGYDVSWWCLNARPSGTEVAALVSRATRSTSKRVTPRTRSFRRSSRSSRSTSGSTASCLNHAPDRTARPLSVPSPHAYFSVTMARGRRTGRRRRCDS